MRVARSISPCRRNRLPSAKCRSIVCGSTLTTSMNDSIALSGCSFSRKLRPRKYDSGSARDSRSRCLMSMRAAIQPRPKNSAGIGSSHHSSKSISETPRQRERTVASAERRSLIASPLEAGARSRGWFPARCPCAPSPRAARRPVALLAAQPVELARQARRAHRAGEKSGRRADRERDQHDEDERRLPAPPVVELERHQLGILQRQEQERQKDECCRRPSAEPASAASAASPRSRLRGRSRSRSRRGLRPLASPARCTASTRRRCALRRHSRLGAAARAHAPLKSTRSRSSLPALKCGTCFSGTCTLSPDLGLRPVRGGR